MLKRDFYEIFAASTYMQPQRPRQAFKSLHGKRVIIAYMNNKGSVVSTEHMLFAYVSGRPRRNFSQKLDMEYHLGAGHAH